MLERFGDGRARHALGTPGAEWSAGGGEDQAIQLGGPASRNALQYRAVLGVHGDDFSTALPRRPGHQLTRHDQRFLIRECDALAGAQGRERGLEASGADDPVHHDLHVGMGRGFDKTRGTLPPSPH